MIRRRLLAPRFLTALPKQIPGRPCVTRSASNLGASTSTGSTLSMGNTGTGVSNFDAQIAMGQQTGDELLVHEIGHALDLRHLNTTAPDDFNPPNVRVQFDNTNIMHNASNVRAFITEGQTVRMHWNPSSIVWTLAPDVGQFSPRPECLHLEQSGACPLIYRRIWADGTFLANN